MKKLLIKFFAALVISSICACATQHAQERIKPCKTKGQSAAVITNKSPQHHRPVNKKLTYNAYTGKAASADGDGTGSTGPKVNQ